jgi:hypothetical protein
MNYFLLRCLKKNKVISNIINHQKRTTRPLFDRIDINFEVVPANYDKLSGKRKLLIGVTELLEHGNLKFFNLIFSSNTLVGKIQIADMHFLIYIA